MYNVHDEMHTFYDRYVRLGDDKQEELEDYRDKNLDRLKGGLTKLDYAQPKRTPPQGSYAMSTIVQHPENDYDIDTAIVFAKDDLPDDPLKARQHVLKAVEKGGGNFKTPPEARTNAVTVWYEAGYHVDLAVYRTYKDTFGGEIVEHAGVEWSRRDPEDITKWFCKQVCDLSPKKASGATVEEEQMSRVVQFIKMFARSRSSWGLPGGLIISVLVNERYVPDYQRDDVALYKTLQAIHSRLQVSAQVLNPVDQTMILTYKDKHVKQVERLRERLGDALRWLEPICAAECDELAAYKAWNNVFDHEYWSELVVGAEAAQAAKFGTPFVTLIGTVYTSKPEEPAMKSPSHRFYGEE